MAVSEEYRQHVLRGLAAVAVVTDRRMFGGLGLYAQQRFFALVDNDVLYLKADDATRGDFEAIGMGRFRPFGIDGPAMDYYQLPERILDHPAELMDWVTKAIGVAERAHKAKPRTRKTATRMRSAKAKRGQRTARKEADATSRQRAADAAKRPRKSARKSSPPASVAQRTPRASRQRSANQSRRSGAGPKPPRGA